MKRKLTTKVHGHFIRLGGPEQTATVVIDPNRNLMTVRVAHCRDTKEFILDIITENAYHRAVAVDVRKETPARPRRFKAKRGLL